MNTFKDIIEYLELKAEFYKTKAQRDILNVLTYAAVRLLIVLVMSMFMLMFSVASGFMIGFWLGEPFGGFLCVAGFYLAIGLGLIYYRKRLSSFLFQKIFQSNLEIFKLDPTIYSLEEVAEKDLENNTSLPKSDDDVILKIKN